MANIEDFHSNLLNIEKKSHKYIHIYHIGYIMIKKTYDSENIHNIIPLYLIINSTNGYFEEKNGERYLILDLTEKYEKVFSEIISEIKTLNRGKNYFMKKIMQALGLVQTMIYL